MIFDIETSSSLTFIFLKICCFLHWIQSVNPHFFVTLYYNGSPYIDKMNWIQELLCMLLVQVADIKVSSQSRKFEFNVFSIIDLNGHNF